MKTIKYVNATAVGLPILLGLLGLIWNELWIFALLSTMLTGLLQVLAGIMYWRDYPESNAIKVYFAGVAFFFVLWYFTSDLDVIGVIIPPALCVFLCWIIYSQKTDRP